MRRSNRRGFTIVELVIVIAVVAVLAAVLIPTFASLVKKANNSADLQLVTNLNKYLATAEVTDGKNTTMAEAMADAAEAGYNAKALISETNTILWDSTTDRFLAVDGTKVVAGADDAEYVEDEGANTYGRYWVISEDISDNYATYLIGSGVFSGETIEINLGLDTSAYTGEYKNVKIKCMVAVTLNGVFYEVDAESDVIPTVYGYVYDLKCSVKAMNATFHAQDSKDYKDSLSEGSTGYTVDHYRVGNGCWFCNYSYDETEEPHVHEWQLSSSCAASCEQFGFTYYQCTDTNCDGAKFDYSDALGHDYSVQSCDELYHWNACSKCGSAETESVVDHTKMWDEQTQTLSCTGCAYKLEGSAVPKTYLEAIKLNKILEGTGEKHETMHSAFGAIAQNDQYNSISAVISEIKREENAQSTKIVWDQSIDRFVVVDDSGYGVDIVYSPSEEGLRGGEIGEYYGTYLLWDTYDELYPIPQKTNQVYSIYWAGTSLPEYFIKKDGNTYYEESNFRVGLDMGSYTLKSDEKIKISFAVGNGGYETPVVFNIDGTINLTISEFGKVVHYGKIDKLVFGMANGWGVTTLDYYEYGEVTGVEVRTKSDSTPYIDVTVHAMPGSTISEGAKTALGSRLSETN